MSMLLGLIAALARQTLSLTLAQTDEIVATTLDRQETQLINHTLLSHPVWNWLIRSPKRQNVVGGNRVRFPVIRTNTDNFGWFGMGDTFNPQRKDILGWSYANLKQGAGDVTLEWLELKQNSGPGQFVSLLEAKVTEVEQTIRQNLNTNAWADGTGSGGDEPTGITGHIPITPTTGTYMGWARASNYWTRSWWYNAANAVGPHPIDQDPANTALTGVGSMIATASQANPQSRALIDNYLQMMWHSIVDSGEDTSGIFHITDLQSYLWYLMIPKYAPGADIGMKEDSFNMGFTGATFMGRPILYDTTNNGAQSAEWRTINTNYYVMYVDTSAFFKWTDWRSPYNALVQAKYLLVRFQVVNIYPRKHGVLTGLAAPSTL